MMTKQHQYLEKKFNWYKKWHQDKLSKFVHYFVLIVVVIAFVFDSFAALFYSQRASAASPWSVDTQAEWNTGSYTNTDATAGGSLELTSQATWYNRTAPTFYDSAYSYRRKITFDNSAYAENMTDFPMMLKLDNASLAWSGKIQADMDDVVFRDADGSTLKWEWETKAPTGESIAWVKIPKIDASSSTDFIYMDYGNPSATDQSDQANTWNTNYKGVWHLNEASGMVYDATSNNHDGTSVGSPSYSQTAKIGNGVGFSTVGSRFSATDINDLDSATSFTFSGWFNTPNYSGHQTIMRKYSGWTKNLEIYIDNNFFVARMQNTTAALGWFNINSVHGAGVWDHFDVVYNGAGAANADRLKIYLNGSAQTLDFQGTTIPSQLADMGASQVELGGNFSNSAQSFPGVLDELELKNNNTTTNWIAAEYKNQGLNTYTTVGAEGTLDGFSYRRTLTFDNSAQAENLTDFPVMVKANNSELNWSSIVQADLDDVIFVDSNNTTRLNWEWETKNSSGESIAWVQVPQIDASSSTDYIYMYYGSATAEDQSVVNSTWESSYHAAWHLNEASGTLYDSTSNDIDLIPTVNNPLYGQVGLIDGCLLWSGADIRVAKASDVPASNRYTVEAWVKPGTQVSTYGYMVEHTSTDGNLSYALLVKGSDLRPMAGHSNSGGSGVFVTGTNPLSTTSWTHLASTYDGANVKLYVNGVYDNQVALPTMYTANPGRVGVGGYVAGRYVGLIDEPVVSYVARLDKWIAAEYKNQGPNTFTTFGAPQNSDSYSYRRKITFDNSAQAENLVNFPVDVKANNSSLAWNAKIQADMDDVIFVDANDTTPLSFEWETKAPAGDSIAWVKVPQVNASSSADYIYMYYGNGTTADHSHQKGVWSNGYAARWRFSEASGNILDSTAFGHTGTPSGDPIYGAVGKIDGAVQFDGTDGIFNVANPTDLDFTNHFTVSLWFKPTNLTQTNKYVLEKYSTANRYAVLWEYVDNSLEFWSLGFTGSDPRTGSQILLSDTNWHHIVYSYDGTTWAGYLDGAPVFSVARTFALQPDATSIMRINVPGGSNTAATLDELRMGATVRTAPWIAAGYKNQTDTFNIIDPEQTPVESTGTYSSVVKDMAFNTTLNLFNATASLGTGTASYSLRTGPTAVPDGLWTGWVAATPGANPDPSLDNNQYAQAKIDLTGDGTTTPAVDSFTLTYASVAGSSTITSPTNGATFGAGDVNMAGTAAANSGAPLDKVEISTDGGANWHDATGTGSWTYLFAGPASGVYNLKSRAHNNDGVYETAGAGITITVDVDKPVSAIGYPTTGEYYSPNLLATGTSSDTGGGIVASLDIRITKQGTGVVKDWTTVTNTGVNFSTWSYSQDGFLEDDQTYLIESRATDNFGNIQTIFGSSTITIDLTYPSSTITSPKLDDKFKVEDRKIDGTATTNNGQALSRVEIRILKLSNPNLKTTADTAGKTIVQDWTAVSGTESWSYIIPNSLFTIYGGGYFQIQTRATNVVDLTESPNPGITILVDDKPPTTPGNIILRDATNYSEGVVALFLQFDKSTDAETKVKEYKITLNGKESILKTPDTEDLNIKNLSLLLTSNQGAKEGANVVLVKAIDEVDNESLASKSVQVEIKKEIAVIENIEIKNVSLVKKQGDEETTSALVKYSSDIPSSTVVFWDQSSPEGSGAKIYTDSAPSQSHTAILGDLVPDTTYKVKIEGIDNYGNKISSDIQSFRSTPKPTEESILSIIIQALRNAFSWVQKVMAAPFTENKDPFEETKDYLALRAIDTTSANDEIQTASIDPNVKAASSPITKTPQIALSYRKNSLPLRNNQNLTGLALNSLINVNLSAKAEKENILDSATGVALDKAPPANEKTTYKLSGVDTSEKVLLPGSENNLTPSISDIQTKEIITSQDKAEYLITFRTDIPSQGKLSLEGQELTEKGNNISHSFYIDNLDSGETIKYSITAAASSGKETKSDDQSFTIPKQAEEKGIWRIIIDALMSAFSWFKNLMK